MVNPQLHDRPWPALALVLAVAVLLLVLAIPRTVAGLVISFGEKPVGSYRSAPSLSDDQVRRLIETRERALRWIDSGLLRADLGQFQLYQARPTGTEPGTVDRPLLERASESLDRGLAASPINAHAWADLSYARHLLGAPDDAVLAAWNMSMLTGPYEPELVLQRLRFSMTILDKLPAAERDLFDRQVRYALEAKPKQLADMALETETAPLISLILAREPAALAVFERRLREAEWRRQRRN